MHRTSQHIHILLRFFVCSMVIAAAVGLFFSNSVIKAAGPAVKVWLTTTDGINHLTPQSDLQFTPDSTTGATAINVDDTQQFQQMDGFGAAITDSSAWLIANNRCRIGHARWYCGISRSIPITDHTLAAARCVMAS